MNDELYMAQQGRYRIDIGQHDGEDCIVIMDDTTGYHEFLSMSILAKLKRDIKQGIQINYSKSQEKLPCFIIRIKRSGSRVSSRKYAWARYKGISLGKMKDVRIMPHIDNRAGQNYQDLRECNLYEPGSSIDYLGDVDVKIIERPNNPSQKVIAVTCGEKGKRRTELCEYIPELYEILSKPKYCFSERCIGRKLKSGERAGGRIDAHIKFARGQRKTVTCNLGKLVCVFKYYFPMYQKRNGAVKLFVHDLNMILDKLKDKHAAHINGCEWLHTFDNLMFMKETQESKPNTEMRDYIRWFGEGYDVFAAVNGNDEILLSINTPFRKEKTNIKFKTAQDYAEMQRLFQGRIDGKEYRYIATANGIHKTPFRMIEDKTVSRKTVDENRLCFWEWYDCRDKLFAEPDDSFIEWGHLSPTGILTILVNGGEKTGVAWLLTRESINIENR